MSIKKTLPFLVLTILVLIFHKPIFEMGFSSFASLVLRFKLDCRLAYRSVEWKDGKMVFSDPSFFDMSGEKCSYRLHAEKTEVLFDWRCFPKKLGVHICIQKPHLEFLENTSFSWPEFEWLNLTLAAWEGTVEWSGVEKACFSYRIIAPNHFGRLVVDWGDSQISFEGFREGDRTKTNWEFSGSRALLLQKLIGFYSPELVEKIGVREGFLDGWAHFVFEHGKGIESSGHLSAKSASVGWDDCELTQCDGSVDWDGPLGLAKPAGLLGDALPWIYEGRIRVAFSRLNIALPDARLENLVGNFSYAPGMGAKWEWLGAGFAKQSVFPVVWKGRGYFSSQNVNWMESEFLLGNSRLAIKGEENGQKRNWAGEIKDVGQDAIRFIQAIFPADWEFDQGNVSLSGNISVSDGEIESWEIAQLDATGVAATQGGLSFSCERLLGGFSSAGGSLALLGGEIRLPLPEGKTAQGNNWSGHAEWKEGVLSPSHFSGWVEGIQTGIVLEGSWNEWRLRSDLGGLISGFGELEGRWNENKMEILSAKGDVEGISFSGTGWVDPSRRFSIEIGCFKGDLSCLSKMNYGISGEVAAIGKGLVLEGDSHSFRWALQALVEKGAAAAWDISDISGEIDADSEGFSCYRMEGDWILSQEKVHFYSPCFGKKVGEWFFDFRMQSPIWDVIRLSGTSDGRRVDFDNKCHFWGAPLNLTGCRIDEKWSLENLNLELELPWEAVLAADPFLRSWGVPSLNSVPLSGSAAISLKYIKTGGSEISFRGIDLQWEKKEIPFQLQAKEREGRWNIDPFNFADFSLSCSLEKEGDFFQISNGAGHWKEGLIADFEGKISSSIRCDFHLSKIKADLASIQPFFPIWKEKIEGILQGEGHLVYDRKLEADFDFVPCRLTSSSFTMENKGPIHLQYDSGSEIALRGLDFEIFKKGQELPWACCKSEIFQCSLTRWTSSRSQIHLPYDCLSDFEARLAFLDLKQGLDLLADLEGSFDLASFSCSMKEGFIPILGERRHIQDLQLSLNGDRCEGEFHYCHQGHPAKIGFGMDLSPDIRGKTVLEDADSEMPLAIDWEYSEKGKLTIRSIEGNFGGIEASFHGEQESNALIGSAKIHFGILAELLPQQIGEAFKDLKMGRGYELKGRLSPDPWSFQGLLSGKQVELFGFQFLTLLGHVELGLDKVRISDVKISDIAGMIKIDEIALKSGDPWTIAIPRFSIQELRPSLLQKAGEDEIGPISPLVVRDLVFNNLKGSLGDPKTWTAKGELHFINSYKREHTVLDLPADVLSRIVGLDLDLLIPAWGTLTYEMKDGVIHLLELRDSYSEGERSQFFLADDDMEPTVDLKGNLKILIKMKQFVLFKLTEAFQISIEGNLKKPEFHLQKKRRFLGI